MSACRMDEAQKKVKEKGGNRKRTDEARVDDLERPVQDLINMGHDLYRLCGRIESAAKRVKKVNPKLASAVLQKIGAIDTSARKLSMEIDDVAGVTI